MTYNINSMKKIEIVSATRLNKDEFWNKSALGLSLKRLAADKRIVPRIFLSNTKGLPYLFNSRIQAENSHDALVFIHDDVWIDDYFFIERIIEGLDNFDVIGLAGNKRRVPKQPGWAFIDEQFTWDNIENLSGAVAHGSSPFGRISFFGTSPAQCELIDGVLMAAKKSTLTDNKVLFDTKFNFHFYDLDFCRSAREKNLTIGTWPIAVTHQSGGNFKSDNWAKKYQTYLDKWKS